MFSAAAVANHILKVAKSKNIPITNMKLQKLAYFAHGHFMAENDGEPLLDETIQAWKYGPVVESLYHTLKRFGNQPIKVRIADEDGETIRLPYDDEGRKARKLIEEVVEFYGNEDANRLVNMTHAKGTPWRNLVEEQKGKLYYFQDIDNKRIKEYFDTLYEDVE